MSRRIALVLLLLAPACLWRSYEKILAIHVEVLTQMADKLSDTAASGRMQGIGEYAYPAKRARQFLDQFAKHRERSSYKGLAAFLDGYERMVNEVDAARPRGEIDIDKLKTQAAALHATAAAILKQAAAGD